MNNLTKIKHDVIVLRGAPGVGKTSVSIEFRRFALAGATVEVDHLRAMNNSVNWTSSRDHTVAIKIAGIVVLRFIEFGYKPVIIVDSMNNAEVAVFASQLPYDIKYKVVSLYSSDAELSRRIEERPIGFSDVGSSIQMNRLIAEQRSIPFETKIDTSNMSVSETVYRLWWLLSQP